MHALKRAFRFTVKVLRISEWTHEGAKREAFENRGSGAENLHRIGESSRGK